MDKVYLVYLDNNADLSEDWMQILKKAFKNKCSALAYIRSEGFVVEGPLWHNGDPTYCLIDDKNFIDEFMYIEEHILK